jgi:predicted SprT family Zn-dependent metalloprotease
LNLFDAEILAKELISRYNPGVTFAWSRTKNTFGDYHYSGRILRLSKVLTPMRPESEVRNTIMHEIAHSLVPPGTKHGRAWQLQMLKFGLKPEACSKTVADLSKVPGAWAGICPSGHIVGRWMRKPSVVRSCSKCSPVYNAKYRIKYFQS